MKGCNVKKLVFFVTIAIITMFSCCPFAQKQFVSACNEYAKVILPDFKDYISKDSSLSDTTKQIRINTADQFQRLIDSAQAKLENSGK
jgi:hypothetical protein